MWCRLTWHVLEEAVLSQELRLVQLLGVDGNSSVILQWEVDCAFFKEWSSMCEDEDEEWVKSVFSTACVTVQQQPSSNQRRISNFSTLKGFLLSETLTETSSTSSPETSGSPTWWSPQPVLPYRLAVTTTRLVLPCDVKLPSWCQASCTVT